MSPGNRRFHLASGPPAALADRLVLKADLYAHATIAALRARLAQLNRSAQVMQAVAGDIDVTALLRRDVYGPGHRDAEVARWFAATDVWLILLLHWHGDKVLRVKGLLNVTGVGAPVVVNGVQHLVYPPLHLARWPDGDVQRAGHGTSLILTPIPCGSEFIRTFAGAPWLPVPERMSE